MQYSYKKTSALGGDGAKVIVTAKKGSFFKIEGENLFLIKN